MNKRQWKKYKKKLQHSSESVGCVIENNKLLNILTQWVIENSEPANEQKIEKLKKQLNIDHEIFNCVAKKEEISKLNEIIFK